MNRRNITKLTKAIGDAKTKTEQAQDIFHGLTTFNGQIVCKDFKTAALFGRAFLKLQREHWGGYEAVTRYTYFSSALKRALELGVIVQTNFLTDDESITTKLKNSSDEIIQQTLEVLRENPLKILARQNSTQCKKFRFIDPPFINGDHLVQLSESDEEFKQLLQDAVSENRNGVSVPNLPWFRELR